MLPTFETERLIIRPRSMTDLEDCIAMDRDPVVTRYIPGPWSDPDRHRAFVIKNITTVWPSGLGYWSVIARDQPETFQGWILLLPYDAVGNEVEIGWRFRRDSWGRGYATEAALLVLDHAIASVGLRTVVADIHPDNTASIRVAVKLGMQLVETRRIDGEPALSYQIRTD